MTSYSMDFGALADFGDTSHSMTSFFKIRNGQKVGLKSYSAEGLVCKIDACFIMNSYPQFW